MHETYITLNLYTPGGNLVQNETIWTGTHNNIMHTLHHTKVLKNDNSMGQMLS